MARSRSRSQSQGRIDPGRRACQMRRFHQELQTRHIYKKELLDCFDSDTLAAIDQLIDEGIDWQVVPDGETPFDSKWMKAKSLTSQLGWIKRWAREAAEKQQAGDGVNGSEQGVAVDAVDANLRDPSAGGDHEQVAAADADKSPDLESPAGFSAEPVDLLRDLQLGDKTHNIGHDSNTVKPNLNQAFQPLATDAPQHVVAHLTSLPFQPGPFIERPHSNPASSPAFPTISGGGFGAELTSTRPQHPSLNPASFSVNSKEVTEPEILVRMREENRATRAAYGEIPREYRDWLLAKKEAGLRRREVEEAEKLCEAAQDKVGSQRDALELAKQELEGAKSVVADAKRRRGAAGGLGSAHAEAVLDRDDNEVELHTLRIERKQKAEGYNSALERCKTAATAHSSVYDAWAKARDASRQADVLEEQRACMWERLRGVRRDSIGR